MALQLEGTLGSYSIGLTDQKLQLKDTEDYDLIKIEKVPLSESSAIS